jgi:hypothetical protein
LGENESGAGRKLDMTSVSQFWRGSLKFQDHAIGSTSLSFRLQEIRFFEVHHMTTISLKKRVRIVSKCFNVSTQNFMFIYIGISCITADRCHVTLNIVA